MDNIKGFFGKDESVTTSTATGDADFADFATASLSSIAHAASSLAGSAASSESSATTTAAASSRLPLYDDGHPWYAFWMRTKPEDFVTEYIIMGVITVVLLIHVVGVRTNRGIARKWMRKHAPVLQKEFALVGFGSTLTTEDSVQSAVAAGEIVGDPNNLLREESSQEFSGYATGRLNISSLNIHFSLMKRSNPLYIIFDWVLAQLFDSFTGPLDYVQLTTYPHEGGDAGKPSSQGSKYDGFVWAVVNKMTMARHRQGRYDLSLTRTIDNAKLPPWLTVMTENGEITDMMLTKELIETLEAAGTSFDYLIVTDQPFEKPTKLSDFNNIRKRIVLQLNLPINGNSERLVEYFVRLTDSLVANAHFRAEVLKKIRNTRDEEKKRFEKLYEEEKAETRLTERDEKKKKDREEKLRGMTADEQKKFLDRERDKETKKMMSKKTRRG